MRKNPIKWPLVIVLICIAILALYQVGFRINVTGSMPKGLYFLQSSNLLKRNDFVVVKLPPNQLLIGMQRQYVVTSDTLLLKRLIALPGDKVGFKNSKVIVNGAFVYEAQRFAKDKHGREMNPIKDGAYLCSRDDYWVLGMNDLSWDSRYFGAVSRKDILNKVRLICVF